MPGCAVLSPAGGVQDLRSGSNSRVNQHQLQAFLDMNHAGRVACTLRRHDSCFPGSEHRIWI
jgi:hypothetical protein